jgi:hypothetical protein
MTKSDLPVLRHLATLSRALRLAAPVLLASSALPACTEFADEDDIGPQNAELPNSPGGGGSQAALAPEWACLDGEPTAPNDALGNTNVTYTMLVVDTVTREPPPGLTVSACSPLDIECAVPMVNDVRPDADGRVRVRVPVNFAGFFQVQSDQTVPAMLFVDGAIVEDTEAPIMLVIGQGPFLALTQSQGVAVDPQMGHLLLRAFDCNLSFAPGIRFTNDRGGQPFAFVDSLPVIGQTVTDAQGTAGFINVLPGLAIVESHRVADNLLTRTASGRVRAGWFTYVDLGASP